jgi:hypothetical protein
MPNASKDREACPSEMSRGFHCHLRDRLLTRAVQCRIQNGDPEEAAMGCYDLTGTVH